MCFFKHGLLFRLFCVYMISGSGPYKESWRYWNGTDKKMGFWLLTAFVVGNMVGSGIFSLPSSLASIASPFGATSAWLLTGAGVLMIALVFGHLSIRKPELTAGPQSYARALFSDPKKATLPVSQWCGATGWRAGSVTWRSSQVSPVT